LPNNASEEALEPGLHVVAHGHEAHGMPLVYDRGRRQIATASVKATATILVPPR
jgi:hypothetical protein